MFNISRSDSLWQGGSGLDVNEETLHRSVGVVDGEMELELHDEQELVVEDDLGGSLLVARDVAHELLHRHVELLRLTG